MRDLNDQQIRSTRAIYDSWHEVNREAISNGNWKLVERSLLIDPHLDPLRGLNIISYLSDEVNELIDRRLIPRLSAIGDTATWTVPTAGRHITVLDIIPHNAGIEMAALGKVAGPTQKLLKIASMDVPNQSSSLNSRVYSPAPTG